MSNLGTVDVAAVRLWLDKRVRPDTPSNVMAGFDAGVGATFFDLNALQVHTSWCSCTSHHCCVHAYVCLSTGICVCLTVPLSLCSHVGMHIAFVCVCLSHLSVCACVRAVATPARDASVQLLQHIVVWRVLCPV